MPRLFAGIPLPPAIRDALAALGQPLPSSRWIDTDDLHITLRFIGDVPPPIAREFTANLSSIVFDPFPLQVNGLATFGGDEPRILYAALVPSQPLMNLVHDTETAARRAGVPPERRKYTPHITLARMQNPRIDPIARYLSRHGGFQTDPFVVTEFALFSAKPNVGGGPYVFEQTFYSSLGTFDHADWDDEDLTENEAPEPKWPSN